MIFHLTAQTVTTIILTNLSILTGVSSLVVGNLTTAPTLTTPTELPHLQQCFTHDHFPGLKPVYSQSCRILVNYLLHGIRSADTRRWDKGKAAAFTMPGQGCRITLMPIAGKESWETTMAISTREIARYTMWLMDRCVHEGPVYIYGGSLLFDYLGFSASLVVLNLSTDETRDHPWGSQ